MDVFSLLAIVFWLPIIIIFDYVLYQRIFGAVFYYKEGNEFKKLGVGQWIVPSVIEVLLFFTGVVVGKLALG